MRTRKWPNKAVTEIVHVMQTQKTITGSFWDFMDVFMTDLLGHFGPARTFFTNFHHSPQQMCILKQNFK